MIKKILFFILCLSILINIVYAVQPTPIPEAESFTFIDLLHTKNGDKELIIFQEGIYYGTYNYSDPIFLNPNVSYTIIIDEDYIDLIQDESFFTHIVNRYGNIFISILIITILLGFIIFVYKKSKGK